MAPFLYALTSSNINRFSHAAVFTSNVQLFALLRDDPLKPATPLTNGAIYETLQQFAPLSDDRLLQLVDCRESSTLTDHLLKGSPNSATDWIQVWAVWAPHVRLDERDFLTPQVR